MITSNSAAYSAHVRVGLKSSKYEYIIINLIQLLLSQFS